MNIFDNVNLIRSRVREIGNYRLMSKKYGVSYEWLCKFSAGKITNPTIENISKLEAFLKSHDDSSLVKNTEELSINDANYKGIDRRNRQC